MNNKDLEILELIFTSVNLETLKAKNPTITEEGLKTLFGRLKKELKPNSDIEKEGLILYIDGASRGNPGRAGIGLVLRDKNSNLVEEACQYIGETTNNVAEYRALIEGLKRVLAKGAKVVEILSDSELLVRQIRGEYRVKSPSLILLYNEAMTLLKSLAHWEISHIPREQNSRADILANMAIDTKHMGF